MTNTNIVKGTKIREWLNENGFKSFVGSSKIENREYQVFKNDEFNAMVGICEEITRDGNIEYWGILASEGYSDYHKIFKISEDDFIRSAINIFVKDYDLLVEFEGFNIKEDIFDDDIAFLEEIVNEASEDEYICDRISDVSDNSVPIYYQELCERCWELNDYVEEASCNGLLEGKFDLFKALSIGAFEYYSQLGYENENEIRIAYLVKYVKEHPNKYKNIFAKSEAFSQCLECLNEAQKFGGVIDIFDDHYYDFIVDME